MKSFAGGFCVLTCLSLPSQSLLKDINPSSVGVNSGSFPSQAVVMGGVAFFAADDGRLGRELWRSDGTQAGTTLVRDISRGGTSSSPSWLTVCQGAVYFAAFDSDAGVELWRSDGSASGTALVKDIEPGAASSSPAQLVLSGDKIYFSATSTAFGREPWVSDGTTNGTRLHADIRSGAANSIVSNESWVATAGGYVACSADDGTRGREPWFLPTLGGSPVGIDVNPSGSSDADHFVATGGKLFFAAQDAVHGRELWVCTPGAPTAVRVTDFASGTLGTTFHDVLDWNGAFCGVLSDSRTTAVLTVDPATLTTNQVFSNSSPYATRPTGLCVHAGALYFGFTSVPFPSQGGDLILMKCTSPTASALVVHSRFVHPWEVQAPARLHSFGSLLLMSWKYVLGTQDDLVAWNGSALVPVKQISTAANTLANAGSFATLNGRVVFVADDQRVGPELWRTDGTPAGTMLLADIAAPRPASSKPADLVAMEGILYFSADDGVHGRELWRSDGTTVGTYMLRDIASNGSSDPKGLFVNGGRLYFAANDGVSGEEPWITDGTGVGTVMLKDVFPGAGSSKPKAFTRLDSRIVFSATDNIHGCEPWVSSGSAGSTYMILDIEPGIASGIPSAPSFVPLGAGGIVLFAATTFQNGTEPWQTNGTAVGTSLVMDILPGPASSLRDALPAPLGYALFAASDGVHGTELWRSGGTASTTTMVVDINPGSGDSDPRGLTWGPGNYVYFSADDGAHGRELWRGTSNAAVTKLVVDFVSGPGSGLPEDLTGTSDKPRTLFLNAFDGVSRRVFKVEGSLNPVAISLPVTGPMQAAASAGAGTLIVFAGDDGTHGHEPFVSDGTVAGTYMLADLWPGNGSSSPSDFVRAGKTCFFVSEDLAHGRELFSVPLTTIGGAFADVFGKGCPGTGGRVPRLLAEGGVWGQPTLRSGTCALLLDNALPLAAAALLFSETRIEMGLGSGCTLYEGLPHVPIAIAIPLSGFMNIQLGIPNSTVLLGVELFGQALIADPSGAYSGLASFSNGLAILVGK